MHKIKIPAVRFGNSFPYPKSMTDFETKKIYKKKDTNKSIVTVKKVAKVVFLFLTFNDLDCKFPTICNFKSQSKLFDIIDNLHENTFKVTIC